MAISFSSLSGGTSFTVVTSTGGSKTATLDKSYPAGTYLIESKALDTNLEVYLGASDGTPVGSAVAGAKTVTASASFLYVTTVNADANDAVIFTLKSASTLSTKTDATWAPPTITDITPSGLPNVNDTTTITGTNFASNVEVKFRKSDDSTLVTPKTTVRGSATSIIATRPDSFAVGDAPYDVIVTNPTTTLSASSLNAITSGAVPVWVTSTTLNAATIDTAFSQTIQATDADGSSTITYAIVSGAFQTGLSFNTSTGAITGTPTGSAGSTTIVISATDSGGNAVSRTFTQVVSSTISVEYLLIAGGGAPARDHAGGGGAGGLLTGIYTSPSAITYNFTIGAGGTGGTSGNGGSGSNGTNSTAFSLTSIGGGGSPAGNSSAGSAGGSGGGGNGTNATIQAGGAGTSGQGYAGGRGGNISGSTTVEPGGGGGGAGGAGQDAPTNVGGAGGVGFYNSLTNAMGAAVSAGQLSGGNYYFAGGGGGGTNANNNSDSSGGLGGGGNGKGGSGIGANGTTNTGGGAGSGGNGADSGNGGSGILIIRVPSTVIVSATTGSPTTATTGGYKYYKFTSSGSITF